MLASHRDAGRRSKRAAARGRFAPSALSLAKPGDDVPARGGTLGVEAPEPRSISTSLTRPCEIRRRYRGSEQPMPRKAIIPDSPSPYS